MKNEEANKPTKNITLAIIVVILIAVSLYSYLKLNNKPADVSNTNPTKEDIMNNQLKELANLRSENSSQQPISSQLKELGKIRKQNASNATTDQIKRQEGELSSLRSAN